MDPVLDPVFHFVYSDKMDPDIMHQHCPEATPIGIGTVREYALRYCSNSPVHGTGVALITPGRRKTDVVHGIVYQVSMPSSLRLLELAKENHPSAELIKLDVEMVGQYVPGIKPPKPLVLQANSVCSKQVNLVGLLGLHVVPPNGDYREKFIAAAKKCGLDERYILEHIAERKLR